MGDSGHDRWKRLADRSTWPRRLWWPAPTDLGLTREEWKKQHDEASNAINTLLIVVIGFSFYCALVLAEPDWKLLAKDATVKLPFADKDIPYIYFLHVGPLVLAGLALYLHILIGHWTNLSRQRLRGEATPAGLPFVFNLQYRSARAVSYLLFYGLAPVLMGLFAWKALPRPESPRIVAMTCTLIASFVFLSLRRRPDDASRLFSYALWLAFILSLSLATVTSLFWVTQSKSGAVGRLVTKMHKKFPKQEHELEVFNYLLNRQLDLKNSDLSNQDLENIYFWHSDLRRANLTKAHLAGSTFECADVSCADLEGVDLFNVQGLTQQEINSAIGDTQTRFPIDEKTGKPLFTTPQTWKGADRIAKLKADCNLVLPQPAKIQNCN